MAPMLSAKACAIAVLVNCGSAFVLRDLSSSFGNSSVPAVAPVSQAEPVPTANAPTSTSSRSGRIAHVESSAVGLEPIETDVVSSEAPFVHWESSVTVTGLAGGEQTPAAGAGTPSSENGGPASDAVGTPEPTPVDVGSIITSIIWPHRTAHLEASAGGFATETGVIGTANGDASMPAITAPPMTLGGNRLTTIDPTSLEIGDTTLAPGGGTATIGEGAGATLVHLDESGTPIVVAGGSTSTYQIPVTVADTQATPIPSGLVISGQTLTQGGSPVTVSGASGTTTLSIDNQGQTIAISNGATSVLSIPASQTFTIGSITATAKANSLAYALGSTALAIGQSITVDGTVVSLTTDSHGSTILLAGSSTLTLPALPSATDLSIQTTVISGTTQYILGDQTLAPGHPITIDGTAISIVTTGGRTALAVGSTTTTFVAATTTGGLVGTESLQAAKPATEGAGAAATSKKGSAGMLESRGQSWVLGLVMAVLVGAG